MTAKNQKNQILESLDYLDSSQTENVLRYIRDLQKSNEDALYQRWKREAMIQIRHALTKGRTLNPGF